MILRSITEWLIDFEIHNLRGIPRPVPGPLAMNRPVEKVEVKTKATPGVYVIDEKTKTFGFTIDRAPVLERNPALTNEDLLLLKKRGYKNHALNARAKRIWAAGETSLAGSKEMKVSHDYTKKLWGTFSASEQCAK